MSIKRMITKLALAFAAKKGIETFNSMGGLSGLRKTLGDLTDPDNQRGGMQGRIGGASDAQTGGLGNILDSLGHAGATGPRETGMTGQISPLNQSLGALFGTLANAFGHRSDAEAASREMNKELHLDNVDDERDATPILRAMVQVARADGAIDEQEQQILFDMLDDASPSEQAILRNALREPLNAQAVARDTPEYARKDVYSAALLVGDPANEKERDYLQNLATALDLKAEEVSTLHRAMGKIHPAA